MKDFDHLVYYLVLYMYAFSNLCACKYNAVFDNSTLVDDAATAENRVLNSSLNLAAIGNNGIADFCRAIIMSRTGIVCTCIDRPL